MRFPRYPPSTLLIAGALAGRTLAPAAEPATQPDGGAHLREAMNGHFVRAKQIQAALIRGDLNLARAVAGKLLDPELRGGLHDLSSAHLDRLEAAAHQTAQAPDLGAAAVAAGTIAQACGSCHAASSVRLSFLSGSYTPAGSQTAPHMLRHQLAVDRMWEGLIGASEAAWMAGARLLDEAPLQSATPELEPARAEQIEILARRVHQLGAQARSVDPWSVRAELFGQLLTACSTCHSLAGIQGQ